MGNGLNPVTLGGMPDYLTPGPFTKLPPGFPVADNLAAVREAVQNTLIHAFWLGAYGGVPKRDGEANLRAVSAMLEKAAELSEFPPGQPRTPDARVQVTCRSFSVLGVALLRASGIPARYRH
ncbi:MAG: transglutaminase-like domain-containing protein [Promicromonosporaceae bacterium]|nr:transglutaminase-like domain-containing protein [Promicromonosporaceae bacterium]